MQEDTRTGRGRQGAHIVIGVDIAKASHLAVVQGPDGWRSKPLRVPNTAVGFAQLLSHAQAARTRWPEVPVGVALEPTRHYWLPLAHWPTAHQPPVWLVNPAHTKWAKFEENSPQKTDPKDAWIVAELAAAGGRRAPARCGPGSTPRSAPWPRCAGASSSLKGRKSAPQYGKCHSRTWVQRFKLRRIFGSLDVRHFQSSLSCPRNPRRVANLGMMAASSLSCSALLTDVRRR